MRTIKIFLASSSELELDRIAFGNFVRKLDDIHERRGWRIKLFEWEDLDSAWNNCRKQDEYNNKVRESDLLLALFHTKAGKFTLEEIKIAKKEFDRKASPKIYVYFRDVQENEIEMPELVAIKDYLSKEVEHFPGHYNNSDSLHLQFCYQIELWKNEKTDSFVVNNDHLFFNNTEIVNLNNLDSTKENEVYKEKYEELSAIINKKIEMLSNLKENQDNQKYRSEILNLHKHYDLLKQEINEYHYSILNLYKYIAQNQGQKIDNEMLKVISLFERGKLHEANMYLYTINQETNSLSEDGNKNIKYKEITEQKGLNAIKTIDKLKNNISLMKADLALPVEYRITKVEELYLRARVIAIKVEYGKKEYIELIYEIADFYTKINRLGDAEKLLEEIKELLQESDVYELSKLDLADVYLRLGKIHNQLYPAKTSMIEMEYNLALRITRDYALNDNQYLFSLAQTLCEISQYYYYRNKSEEAEAYCVKGVEIYKQIRETGDYEIQLAQSIALHASILSSNANIFNLDKIDKMYDEAIEILEKNSSVINVVKTLINRGNFWYKLKLYKNAISDYRNALLKIKLLQNDLEICDVYEIKAKTLYNLTLVQKAIDVELYQDDIENEYKEALGLYIDLESISFGSYLSRIMKVIEELGAFYQIIGNLEKLRDFKVDLLRRMDYLNSKTDGKYLNVISDVSSIFAKYESSII